MEDLLSGQDEQGNETRKARRVSSKAQENQQAKAELDYDIRTLQRAQLQHVQSVSVSFRGFNQEELDALFPLFDFIEVSCCPTNLFTRPA